MRAPLIDTTFTHAHTPYRAYLAPGVEGNLFLYCAGSPVIFARGRFTVERGVYGLSRPSQAVGDGSAVIPLGLAEAAGTAIREALLARGAAA